MVVFIFFTLSDEGRELAFNFLMLSDGGGVDFLNFCPFLMGAG